MKRTLTTAILGLAFTCTSALLPSALQAAGPIGKLVYVHTSAGAQRIVLHDTLTGQKAFVPNVSMPNISRPNWSPDGQWLTFGGGPAGASEIYKIRPDGTGFQALTGTGNTFVDPDWCPCGTNIAFQPVYGFSHSIKSDGTGLETFPVRLGLVRWSPDGTKLLGSNWGTEGYESVLRCYHIGSGTLTQITAQVSGAGYNHSDWSPDGRHIVAARVTIATGNYDLFVMDSDGANLQNLTPNTLGSKEYGPSWSPDGQWIFYLSDAAGNNDVWAMRPDGSDRMNLTLTAENEEQPPDFYPSTPPAVVYDDFEDGVLDPSKWKYEMYRVGYGGIGGGTWQHTITEIPGTGDGYLEMRVWGPNSANTYGAEGWLRTTQDFNDGKRWKIEWTWQPIVGYTPHVDEFAILLAYGDIPASQDIYRVPNRDLNPSQDYADFETLWATYVNFGVPPPQPNGNFGIVTWSLEIEPNGSASLYHDGTASGTPYRTIALDKTKPWHLAFFLDDATSAGYPPGDNQFRLFNVSVSDSTAGGPCPALQIPSTQAWTDTGIDVVAGQVLTVTASGTVLYHLSDPKYPVNPDGVGPALDGTWLNPDAVLPNAISHSLIGKIGGTTAMGTGTPVPEGLPGRGAGWVGSSYSQTIPVSGRLFLGFNDSKTTWGDNVGAFSVTVCLEASCVPIYTQDFSSDPAWTTDDQTKLVWDESTKTFHGTQVNTEGTYAYVDIPGFDPNKSWRLQWDHIVNACDWSAGITFGLFDERLRYPYGAIGEMGLVDGGRPTAMIYNGSADSLYSPPWSPGVWYRSSLEYNADTHQLTLTVNVRSTDALLLSMTRTNSSSFPASTTRLGVSRLAMKNTGSGASGSASVDYNLDNIILCQNATNSGGSDDNSLVAYYPLDGNATNTLGTGNDGICNGAIPSTDRCGNPNAACELNGYADISFPSGPPLDPQGSFTYAFWMVSTLPGDYPFYSPHLGLWFVDRTVETTPLFSLAIVTVDYGTAQKGQFYFWPRANDWSSPSAGGSLGAGIVGGMLAPQQWQHITMVREYGTSYKLYVNGEMVGSGEDSGSPLTPPPLKLGRHAWNGQLGLVGKFDDLRIYSRALSAAEVAKLAADTGCGTDMEAPVITCPPDVVALTSTGLCSAVVEFAVTATDNSGNVTVVCSPASGSVFLKGATPVTCVATDASGNTASCVFTVTVHDDQTPVIFCPTNITVGTDPGLCSALVDPGTPTIYDNCGATLVGIRNDGLALTNPYPKGTTLITWTAVDEGGNMTNCTQAITVDDWENPSITIPQDVLVASDAGSCSATGVALGAPIAADNCEVAGITNDHPSTTFPLGETIVSWTVADERRNTATAQQKVTVLSSMIPTLLPPLAGQPVANKIRHGQVVPHKVTLADCSGAAITAGVTVKLSVQGINSFTGEVFQDVPEDAAGVGNDGTVTSDGIMVLNDGKYQFNLDTSNFSDPNTWANPTNYYRCTITVIDNGTLIELGSTSLTLETR